VPVEQVTLVANTVATVNLNEPTERITVRLVGGTAAEVYCTADGSLPVIPTSGVEISDGQQALAAVLGDEITLEPPLVGGHEVIPVVNLLSAGTPIVEVLW
jgi:hypothetical protein